MPARDVADRFRRLRYTQDDLACVVTALAKHDDAFLRDVVASYIKYVDDLDERALVRYLKTSHKSWAAHEIIAGLSILRCDDGDFAMEVLRYAKGLAGDDEGYARIAAVAAMPRILKGDARVGGVLAQAARSDNVVVSETAMEAAQEFLGTPLAEIERGEGDGRLAHKVPRKVRDWLGLTS